MIPLSFFPIWIALLFTLPTASGSGDCFNPDGTNRNIGAGDVASDTSAYFPCNTVMPNSMCCRSTDKCLANGLCQQGGSSKLWRESCTDPTWRSDACVKLCISATDTDVPLVECNDGSYCCNGSDYEDPESCCAQGKGLWVVEGKVTNKNPNDTSSSTTSLSSTSSTSSARARATNTAQATATVLGSPAQNSGAPSLPPVSRATSAAGSNGDGGTNTGAIVGGVVGGVVALGFVVGIAAFLLRRRRRARDGAARPQIPPMQESYYTSTSPAPPPQHTQHLQPGADMAKRSYYDPGLQEADAGAYDHRSEMDSGLRAEMPAAEVKR